MTVIDRLAISLGRRDEVPNQELAKEIAHTNDKKAVLELVENLSNKKKDIQHDCIKVLYEVGYINPKLISGHMDVFIDLLTSKNNRLQWGAMTALNTITNAAPDSIYRFISKIADAAEKGSVITKDNYVGILVKLSAVKKYSDAALTLLNEQLLRALPNQFPMYAEHSLPVINEMHKTLFIKTLKSRLDDMEKESKRKRVEKVLKKLGA